MSKLNISRRDFLKAAGVSAAALGLTACGGSSSSTAASGSASAAGSTASAGGSNWPTDTVSFYVPAKAGGGTDMTARVFLQGINEVHPGNYIVVNDVTGGGTVAAENVRNAKPDGLNLLAYHTGLCTSIASGQYAHDLSEFTICGMFITVPDEATGGLFVPGNSKFDKLEDLIAYGKEHPGELMAGMQNGSSTQLIEVLFEKEFDFQATMVDAGSNADKVTALMGNQIDYCFMNTTGNDQYVQSGDLKCLVAWGGKGCKVDLAAPVYRQCSADAHVNGDLLGADGTGSVVFHRRFLLLFAKEKDPIGSFVTVSQRSFCRCCLRCHCSSSLMMVSSICFGV